MQLYTKNNCSACEEVKMMLDQMELGNKIVITNVTNDLVKVMNIKEKLEAQGNPMTFPVLELEDKTLINPSAKIKDFLQYVKKSNGENV